MGRVRLDVLGPVVLRDEQDREIPLGGAAATGGPRSAGGQGGRRTCCIAGGCRVGAETVNNAQVQTSALRRAAVPTSWSLEVAATA